MLLLQSILYFSRNLNSFALFLAKLWSEIYFMPQYRQIYLIMVLRWKISWRHKMTSSYWNFLKLSCNSTFPNILLQWIFGDNCIIFRKVTRYENSDTSRQNCCQNCHYFTSKSQKRCKWSPLPPVSMLNFQFLCPECSIYIIIQHWKRGEGGCNLRY